MASLRDTVKDYQDELRGGIAWVVFWREKRSWDAQYLYLENDDRLSAEERSRLEEIRQIDPAAVVLNSYYCGQLAEDMTIDELTAGVRHHYENGFNNIADFIDTHDDRLPPGGNRKRTGSSARRRASLFRKTVPQRRRF